MSAGELTGDAYPDVVVGIIQTGAADGGVGSGAVLILNGSAAGPVATSGRLISEATPGVPTAPHYAEFFGYAVRVAPLHGTAHPNDLAVGADLETVGQIIEEGAVFVIPGAAHTGPTGAGTTMLEPAPGTPAMREGDNFGAVLA
jgi:hypothetical protein